MIDKAYRLLVTAERVIAVTLMAAIVGLVFVAAASRYLGSPINWSVDLAQALFVWVVYLGASIALRRRRHIGVDLAVRLLPWRLQRLTEIVGNLIVAAFLAYVCFLGIRLSIINVNRELTSIAISYSWVTSAVSVGAVLMILTLMIQTVQAARQMVAGEQ